MSLSEPLVLKPQHVLLLSFAVVILTGLFIGHINRNDEGVFGSYSSTQIWVIHGFFLATLAAAYAFSRSRHIVTTVFFGFLMGVAGIINSLLVLTAPLLIFATATGFPGDGDGSAIQTWTAILDTLTAAYVLGMIVFFATKRPNYA